MQDVFSYIFVETFCFVLLLVIFIKMNRNPSLEYEFKVLRLGIIVFFVYLTVDIISNLSRHHFIHFSWTLCTFADGMVLFSVCLLCFIWLIFTQASLNGKRVRNTGYLLLFAIPLFISALLCICSVKNGWLFYIDESGTYQRGPMFMLQLVIDYFYYTWSTVFAIWVFFSSENQLTRVKALTIAGYVLIPTVGGIAQVLVPGTPIVAMTIFIPTFLVFVNFQNTHIFKDILTGLNNRRRADIFLANLVNSIRKKNSYYIFLFDINNFKHINDEFGHLEGDKALEYTSRCLKAIADSYSGFLARYGGDEFIIIALEDNIPNPDYFVSELKLRLLEFCKNKALPYNLSLSVGYVKFDDPNMTADEIFAAADSKLYESKRKFHRVY